MQIEKAVDFSPACRHVLEAAIPFCARFTQYAGGEGSAPLAVLFHMKIDCQDAVIAMMRRGCEVVEVYGRASEHGDSEFYDGVYVLGMTYDGEVTRISTNTREDFRDLHAITENKSEEPINYTPGLWGVFISLSILAAGLYFLFIHGNTVTALVLGTIATIPGLVKAARERLQKRRLLADLGESKAYFVTG